MEFDVERRSIVCRFCDGGGVEVIGISARFFIISFPLRSSHIRYHFDATEHMRDLRLPRECKMLCWLYSSLEVLLEEDEAIVLLYIIF
jgi:hypothetical protein